MLTNNKDSHKRILGDKRTYGTRNVPFFWNSIRYRKENIYHCIATSLFILAFIFAVVLMTFIIIESKDKTTPVVTAQSDWTTSSIFAMVVFLAFISAIIMKLNERKIKKMRMKDTVEAADREIKILGGNK